MAASDIESVLKEQRVFPPDPAFAAAAHVKSLAEYERIYRQSVEEPEAFWAGVARELDWFTPWTRVLDWNPPDAKWFVGATLNISYNCLDRHLTTWRRNKAAIIWEGEPGDRRVLTYQMLHREVVRCAAALKQLGVRRGDRVAIYMPMIPELPIAMLACARIGATHSIVFGGFSAEALRDRINDAEAKVVITADGGFRRGAVVALKQAVDAALVETPSVEKVVVVRRTESPVEMRAGRDLWWHDVMAGAPTECPAEPLDAEHPLFILYTSGTTGKPKGVVHTTGGYLTHVYLTSKWVFDLKDDDTFWCTADIGWVTGHSYVVYGPLANGATTLMYEGAPNQPQPDRFWEIVERYGVTILYTAPTAIRTFTKWGDEWP
jgi:acetyl-CoA synthetase